MARGRNTSTATARCNRPASIEVIQVVAGILQRATGDVLVAQRPAGTRSAGRWEFPGGKREAGESAEDTLRRELREELGIEVVRYQPFMTLEHQYSDRNVLLSTWRITEWDGSPVSLDGQGLRWAHPADLDSLNFLDADWPLVRKLQTEQIKP